MSNVGLWDPTQQQDHVLVLKPAALEKARTLIIEEENPNLKLRVYITGGGCSGFQYGFSFDDQQQDDDYAMHCDGLTVLIDTLSYPYLVGAHVDYIEGLSGARFTVHNPNATTTCSCGSSFAV